MIITVSPAKKLNETAVTALPMTKPDFIKDAEYLAKVARGLSVKDLQKLMHISENLATLNAKRFAEFSPDAEPALPAVYAFAGDTYQGLEAATLDDDAINWAQDHLRILSGLYGVLRPLDEMHPYRLEMGSRLKNKQGKNLYEYWGARLAEALNAQAHQLGTDTIINCASVEYFSAVDLKALTLRVITPVFMEPGPDGPRIVSFYAKKARGAMARYIIERRLSDPEGLKEFDLGGYRFQPQLSEGDKWVFVSAGVDQT